MIAPVLLAMVVSAVDPTVHLASTATLTADLRQRVEHERGAVRWVDSATTADLVFGLRETPNAIEVRHTQAQEMLEVRTVDIVDREAGIRVVVLLIVNAIDDYVPLPPEPPPPPPPPVRTSTPTVERPSLRFGVGGSLVTWNDVFTVQLGADVRGAARVGPIWIGARFAGIRLCCSIDGGTIRANALSLAGTIDAEFPIVEGDFGFGIGGGAGAAWDRVSAVAVFLGGTGPPDITTGWGLAVRATGMAHVDVAGLRLTAELGLWLQTSALAIRLPPPFDADGTTLTRGLISPYFSIGASYLVPE